MMTLDRKNRRGILIDWDHCVLVSRVRGASRISRTVCLFVVPALSMVINCYTGYLAIRFGTSS